MGWKDTLGNLSPVYGAVTGRGQMGAIFRPNEHARMLEEEQAKQAAAEEQANVERQAQVRQQVSGGMKKGGKVKSASSRGDGIAQRGKTKGMLR